MSSIPELSILYADYSPKAASLVREALQPLNISAFYTSETQEETLAMAHRYRPNLVMVSLQLDGYQGIKTIGYLRALSRNNDPYFNQVPVLLGAKSLSRDAMRRAIAVGIEGVFRQPVNPDRLNRIVNTVVATPRRFVLDGDYFGPSPQKTAETIPPVPERDANDTTDAAPNDAGMTGSDPDDQSNTDLPALRSARQSNAGVILRPTRKTASVSRLPLRKGRGTSGSGPALSDEDLAAAAGERPQPKTLDASDLVRSNQDAAKSPLPLETAPVPDAKAPPATEAKDEDKDDDEHASGDDQNLIEIDIKTALLTHKTWVDTGGKEGQMVSFDHADLRNEDLEGIDLTRCVLPQASLHNANCEGAVLRRCDLTMANFTGANLKNAILAASRLSGANFKDAQMAGTVFLGADLANANLRGAKLTQCDFSGCNLSQTDLRDADLSSAKGLFSEQIQRARINANTRLPRDMKLKTV